MFRRAKISVLFPLLGALAAAGAELSPGQRATAFQPGPNNKLAGVTVLKPAQATVPNRLWTGVQVQRITARPASTAKVELSGISVTRAADGVVAVAPVTKAGGNR